MNASIRAVAGVLRDEIREGFRFSKALVKASPSFDELYCSFVAAGEASGSLPEILRRLVVSLKQLFDLQRRTAGAMIYPITVLLACVVLLFVFSTVLMRYDGEDGPGSPNDHGVADHVHKFHGKMVVANPWDHDSFGNFIPGLHRLRERSLGYKMRMPAFGR